MPEVVKELPNGKTACLCHSASSSAVGFSFVSRAHKPFKSSLTGSAARIARTKMFLSAIIAEVLLDQLSITSKVHLFFELRNPKINIPREMP